MHNFNVLRGATDQCRWRASQNRGCGAKWSPDIPTGTGRVAVAPGSPNGRNLRNCRAYASPPTRNHRRPHQRTVLIRLSHPPTTGSILGIRASLGRPWLSTYLSKAICRFRARCRSFSDCSRTKRRAWPILSALDGAMGLFAGIAGRPANHDTSLPATAYFVAGNVAATQASPPALSWSARTRRSRSGFGRPT